MCINIYIYAIYMHACMHACIHTYIHIYIHVYAFYMHCMNIPPAKHIETIHQPLPPLLTRLPAAAMAERAPEAAPSDSCPVGDMFKGYIWKICCGLIGDLSKFVGCMICMYIYIYMYVCIWWCIIWVRRCVGDSGMKCVAHCFWVNYLGNHSPWGRQWRNPCGF